MVTVTPVKFDAPSRSWLPLPALTVRDAVSQLVWRALGPLPDNASTVVRWAHAAEPDPTSPVDAVDAGGRFAGWSHNQLNLRIRKVREVGCRTPLHPAVVAELLDYGTLNSVRHQRARRLFALKEPASPQVPLWLHQNTKTALRVLTAVGPAPIGDLLAAVDRTHRYRTTRSPTVYDLARGLTLRGAVYTTNTQLWSAPVDLAPSSKDAALVQAWASRLSPLCRGDVLTVLQEAGYQPATTRTPTIDTHPLIRHVGPNQYALLGVSVVGEVTAAAR